MTDARAAWLADEDPRTLVRRVERVVAELERSTDAPCSGCGTVLCGHAVLFSLSAGHQDAPLCERCLHEELDGDPVATRARLVRFVLSKDCLRRGWRIAGLREGTSSDERPECLVVLAASGGSVSTADDGDEAPAVSPVDSGAEYAGTADAGTAHADEWDAGDLACGTLVLRLRMRMKALAPGDVLLLTATDDGAPNDIPAWCRLTGHALVAEEHPRYWIRRRPG